MQIKYVIKRNGLVEEFTPNKLNHWAKWAAKEVIDSVDWPSVVMSTVKTLPEKVTSKQLQEALIKTCLNMSTDKDIGNSSYNLMAGHLYNVLTKKDIYGNSTPTIKELHNKLYNLGLMVKLDYSDDEYDLAEKFILHSRDFSSTHSELSQVLNKYSIQNKITKEKYETQQFTYMRMAMALAEDMPKDRRMEDVKNWYNEFSLKRINAPTPNYVNLGTPLKGYFSCCLYKSDDNAKSLSIGDHIAYMMTCMSSGIGNNLNTRSIGDPVRKGAIVHQGRLPYYASLGKAVKANLQNGRGGACTTFFSCFDPQIETILQLKNPKSTENKRNRDIDYAFITNKFFNKKVAQKNPEDRMIFTFNSYNAPDLYKAFYSGDENLFEEIYNKYENDILFPKTYLSAREVFINFFVQSVETGRIYHLNIDETNRHTPFKDPIYSSNLCLEIVQPTRGYTDMMDLYTKDEYKFDENGNIQEKGEIALCSLGAIDVAKFDVYDYEAYSKTMYYTLLMIDRCIQISDYAFPHLETTAKARNNAGIGMVGLAYFMAKNGLKYATEEGKKVIHQLAERHMYCAIEQSLRLGKQLGNAKWMHKTKWPEGWLPIDTYNKNVDSITDFTLNYNWEDLRKRVIANGGIRNSVLVAHMPSESSSKATGTTNGLYPIRDYSLLKTDNESVNYWVAPSTDKYKDNYEIVWDIETKDLIDLYAIVQKFTDQTISADLYLTLLSDDKVPTTKGLKDHFYMVKMGIKSRYYLNTKNTSGGFITDSNESDACAGGSCKL